MTKMHSLNIFFLKKVKINTDLSIFCQDQNLKVFEVLTFQAVCFYIYTLSTTPLETFKVTGSIFFSGLTLKTSGLDIWPIKRYG